MSIKGYILRGVGVVVILAALIFGVIGDGLDVAALPGTAIVDYYMESTADDQYNQITIPNATFATKSTWSNTSTSTSATVGYVGWGKYTSSSWYMWRMMMTFDMSAIPDDAIIKQVTVGVYYESQTTNDYGLTPSHDQYYALYTSPDNVSSASAGTKYTTHNNTTDTIRRSGFISYAGLSAGQWVEFDLTDPASVLPTDNFTTFSLMCSHDVSATKPYTSTVTHYATFRSDDYADSAYHPYMKVTYEAETPGRTITTRANNPKGVKAGDNITSITTDTPRTSYNDEGIMWTVAGDVGASITGVVYDSLGKQVGSSFTDEVRDDGDYHATWFAPASFSGLLRLNVGTMYSDWMYATPCPNTSSTISLVTQVGSKDYPHWAQDYKNFKYGKNNLILVHWKTNIDTTSDNETDYRLVIYRNNGESLYSATLDTLYNGDYVGGGSYNSQLIHWRYLVLRIDKDASQSDYDDLILDLDDPMDGANSGHYWAEIQNVTSGETITTTHSMAWFTTDDVTVVADKKTYGNTERPKITITYGPLTKVSQYLTAYTVTAYDSSNNVGQIKSGTITTGSTTVEFDAKNAGAWTFRVKLSSPIYNSVYWRDTTSNVSTKPTTGSGSGTGTGLNGDGIDFWAYLDTWLGYVGLANPAGYWFFLIAFALVWILIARKSKALQIGGCLGILAMGLLRTWVEPWLIIVLAFGAGFTLWFFFARKASASGQG